MDTLWRNANCRKDHQAFNLGIGKDLGLFGAFSLISRRPIRHLQMAPVTVGNRLNPSTANPSTRTGTNIQVAGYRYSTQRFL
ncbi:fimbria/pilus outer membrane usher protein [Escherichia coli]